jgi:hypothetical protein
MEEENSLVTQILSAIVGLVFVVTAITNPKKVFIEWPINAFFGLWQRVLTIGAIVTFPIWFPISWIWKQFNGSDKERRKIKPN